MKILNITNIIPKNISMDVNTASSNLNKFIRDLQTYKIRNAIVSLGSGKDDVIFTTQIGRFSSKISSANPKLSNGDEVIFEIDGENIIIKDVISNTRHQEIDEPNSEQYNENINLNSYLKTDELVEGVIEYIDKDKLFDLVVKDSKFNALEELKAGDKLNLKILAINNNIDSVGDDSSEYESFIDFLKLMIDSEYQTKGNFPAKIINYSTGGYQKLLTNFGIIAIHFNFSVPIGADIVFQLLDSDIEILSSKEKIRISEKFRDFNNVIIDNINEFKQFSQIYDLLDSYSLFNYLTLINNKSKAADEEIINFERKLRQNIEEISPDNEIGSMAQDDCENFVRKLNIISDSYLDFKENLQEEVSIKNNNWYLLPVNFYIQTEIFVNTVFIKKDDEKFHFLINLKLDVLGDIQLEGKVDIENNFFTFFESEINKFEFIIRSKQKLNDSLIAKINKIFDRQLSLLGLFGKIDFDESSIFTYPVNEINKSLEGDLKKIIV